MARTLEAASFPASILDPFKPSTEGAHEVYQTTHSNRLWLLPLALGGALLLVSLVGWFTEPQQFFYSYLVGWSFCLTISLGALIFVLINHIVKAHWVVTTRRVPEALAWSFPVLAILGIPVLLGMHDLYHWTHAELYDPADPHYDEILVGKKFYLNVPFFFARYAIYFLVWSWLGYKMYSLSLRQDVDPDADIPAKQRKWAAIGIPLFAVTLSFASYDFLMSLDPHWFSTIFGVYIFAGAFMSFFATGILIYAVLQRGDTLRGVVTTEHYHDWGKFLFAFTAFWAYIAFSQYMLYWYGGLPEETQWFRKRMEGAWAWHTYALVYGHFVLPFLLMLPRKVKRTLPLLSIMAVWMLVMQWFDLHYIAMGELHHEAFLGYAEGASHIVAEPHAVELGHGAAAGAVGEIPHAENRAGFHWLDFVCWFGITGVWLSTVLYRVRRHPLVPMKDPRLARSLHFHNI